MKQLLDIKPKYLAQGIPNITEKLENIKVTDQVNIEGLEME